MKRQSVGSPRRIFDRSNVILQVGFGQDTNYSLQSSESFGALK